MAIIKIDTIDCGVDSMSNEYRVRLASIQFAENELTRLQALQSTLPVVGVSSTNNCLDTLKDCEAKPAFGW